jgi:hypothetical protein
MGQVQPTTEELFSDSGNELILDKWMKLELGSIVSFWVPVQKILRVGSVALSCLQRAAAFFIQTVAAKLRVPTPLLYQNLRQSQLARSWHLDMIIALQR